MDIEPETARGLFRYGVVGQCVSSVAHDVNNTLGAILAYADLMSVEQGLTEEMRDLPSRIVEAVRQCSSLVNTLATIARKEKPDASVVQLTDLVQQVIALTQYDFKVARIPIQTSFAKRVPSAVVDLPKLELALIMLLANAREALEGQVDARVSVTVRTCDNAAEIAVWNSGPPVPEADGERIFEPLYSTKAGAHVGLGLTCARETARLHGGDLSYDVDRGFVLRLPKDTRLSRADAVT